MPKQQTKDVLPEQLYVTCDEDGDLDNATDDLKEIDEDEPFRSRRVGIYKLVEVKTLVIERKLS